MTVFNEFSNGVYFASMTVARAEEIITSSGNSFSREVIKKTILDVYREISHRQNIVSKYVQKNNDWLFAEKPSWVKEMNDEIKNLEFLKDNLVARL